jgi:hypothetical protein
MTLLLSKTVAVVTIDLVAEPRPVAPYLVLLLLLAADGAALIGGLELAPVAALPESSVVFGTNDRAVVGDDVWSGHCCTS